MMMADFQKQWKCERKKQGPMVELEIEESDGMMEEMETESGEVCVFACVCVCERERGCTVVCGLLR